MRSRPVLFLLLGTFAALAIAGCGGGGSSQSEDPAAVAPASSPLFVALEVRPEGETKSNLEALVEKVAGIDDLGGLVISELEKSASDSGEEFDYAKEVEPWLGEQAGIFFESFDGNDFHSYGVAVQTTDAEAAQAFVDKQSKSEAGPAKDGSYEGIDYKVEQDDGQTVGVIGDLLVLAEDEKTFKDAIDASNGSGLAEDETFASATSSVPSTAFANIYADVGGLLEQSEAEIEPQVLDFLDQAGIDPDEATLTASLVPGSDQLEIDVSSDLGTENASAAGASKLLGELPADSVAAFAGADFGESLEEGLDELDATGIPGEISPHELKKTMKAAGFDLEKIVGSLDDIGIFVQGSGEADLGGAAVLTADGGEAVKAVGNIGTLLRASGTAGITALSGKFSGFSVRSDDLGDKPVVVAAKDDKIAIAYGPAAAAEALAVGSGETLGDSQAYKDAVGALGDTPITGFVDGPAAVRLVEGLLSPEDAAEFEEAKPYLAKASYLAIGGAVSDGITTAKLILGLDE